MKRRQPRTRTGTRFRTPPGTPGSARLHSRPRYTSFLAESTALFGIVVGIALILAGIGFIILAPGGALRRSRAAE
jgi:hypothetical protein